MNKPLALILALPALLLAGADALAANAFQSRCEAQLPKIAVELNVKAADYIIDETVGSKVLNTMSTVATTGDRMLGMTSIRSVIDFGYDGPSLQDPQSGMECIAPHIDVDVRYNPVKIYIAREFPHGSCPFREVLAHELRHVKAYQEHVPRVEAALRAALEKRFADGLLYGPAGYTYAELKLEVEKQWVPFIREELRKIEPLHASIDTSEETFRMTQACQGEVSMILGNRY